VNSFKNLGLAGLGIGRPRQDRPGRDFRNAGSVSHSILGIS
jgi:hypothetical protein